MPPVEKVIEDALGRKAGSFSKSAAAAAVVWTVDGVPEASIHRFGSNFDLVWFSVLRWNAYIDAIWVPFFLSFVSCVESHKDAMIIPILIFSGTCTAVYTAGVWFQLYISVVDLAAATETVYRKGILQKRMRTPTFWMDVISLFGILWIPTGIHEFAVLTLLRAWRLAASSDDLYELQLSRFESENVGESFRNLFFNMFLIIHIIACAWFYALTYHPELEDALSTDPRWLGGSLMWVYITCFSRGASMLVGWGWAAPLLEEFTKQERLFHAMFAPFAAICSAYIFAQIIALSSAASEAARHLAYLGDISNQITTANGPESLKMRTLQFHTFLSVHSVNKGAESESSRGSGGGAVSVLSRDLRKEWRLYEYQAIISDAPFFQDLGSADIIKLVLAFTEEVHAPGEFIIRKGEIGRELYFVMKGSCVILSETFTELANKEVGEYFGEVALLCESERNAHVQSRGFSLVANLKRDALSACLTDVGAKLKLDRVIRRTIHPSELPKDLFQDDVMPPDVVAVQEPDEEHINDMTPLLSPRSAGKQMTLCCSDLSARKSLQSVSQCTVA